MKNAAMVINIEDKKREDAAARYRDIKEQMYNLAREEKELKNYLMSFVADNEAETVGKYTIIHKVSTSRGLDRTALKKVHPELWTDFGKISENHKIEILHSMV